MCECGCGEMTNPVAWFPGPPGFTYGLALYGGCMDCGNPAWFTISKVPDAELQHFGWGDEPLTPLRFVKFAGWEEVSVPLGPETPKATHHRLARAGFNTFLREQTKIAESVPQPPEKT